ncbi:MAG TPA: M20 aminoacylase family protein [Magnetospirillaceae bacterium]|jgi:hippurate hydrolase
MTVVSKEQLKAQQDELVSIRRDIHRHPETAYEENRTSDVVAAKLTEWGIEVHRGLAKTGVVGTLKGKRPGQRAIGLRADMDALFINEQNTFEHRSSHDGKMHACGHDGHTTMLLGAARRLSQDPDFAGTVHFIFQPAEEGGAGGRVMIEEGLFNLFPCDAVYGMHNMPGTQVGKFAVRPGPMMAAADLWNATFHGTGGHGAMPHLGTDPTIPAAQFVIGAQSIIGRNVTSTDAAVISVGHIHGGAASAHSVIPADVAIAGTARSFKPAVRDLLERRLGELARGIAQAHGCTVDFHYDRRYPALINAPEQTEVAMAAARKTVGDENVNGNVTPIMGAEDFAFMLEAKPGAYILIGNGGDGNGGGCHHIHTPLYDFNDVIIETGVSYWTNLVAEELRAP